MVLSLAGDFCRCCKVMIRSTSFLMSSELEMCASFLDMSFAHLVFYICNIIKFLLVLENIQA